MQKKNVPAAGTVKKNVSTRAKQRALRRKRQMRNRIIIGAAALIVLIVALILILGGSSGSNDVTDPAATAEVTSVPTAEPTAAPTAQPIVYLPVITKGNTNEKKICITVDDCFQVDNLNELMTMCNQYGAKITIFPIGHVVYEKPELQAALRRAIELGFEIENHTYTHSKLYAWQTDEELAADIYKQNMVINYALGMEYEMHFLRMMGGNGEKDLRSHQYLNQLGYKAIAHWGFSGSDDDLAKIKKRLEPGQIYLFHTTNSDFKKLKEFIPYCISQGYQLVTLNEMFGLEKNATRPLTGPALEYEIPQPLPFVYTEEAYADMSKAVHTQMYAVQLVQRRLQELGYLSMNAVVDGDYGSTTEAAIISFQNQAGLTADGICGKGTQAVLFSDTAPRSVTPPIEPAAK